MITPFHSGVLLRLRGDISDTAFGGVKVQDFHSPHNSMSLEAEVVAISKYPRFMGKEMEAMRRGGPDVREIADLCSLQGDVPIEVKVGDTVIFDWRRALADAEKAYKVEEGMLVVSYSDLIARVDSPGLYPLNGLVFVVAEDHAWLSMDVGGERTPDLSIDRAMDVFNKTGKLLIAAKVDRGDTWRVIAEGVQVKGWLDQIDAEIGWPPLLGKTVFCDYRSPIAIESPLFSKYDHGGKRFHILNRHHIFAYLN